MSHNPYNVPLSSLARLQKDRAAVIEKETGCSTVEDLLYYFPRRYLDRTLSQDPYLRTGQQVTLIVQINSSYLSHGRTSRLIVQSHSLEGTRLTLIWFRGSKYLSNLLSKGMCLVVSGKLEFFQGLQITHPEFEILDPNKEKELIHTGRIIPLYPLSDALKKKRLDSRSLRRLILNALDWDKRLPPLPEILPQTLLQKHGLIDRHEALRSIHFPESPQAQEAAQLRLKYEELYLFQVLMYHKALLREKIPRVIKPLAYGRSKACDSLLCSLPFSLTPDQQKAIQSILTSCQKDSPAAFLLQGDVGSGKTLVALAIALHYKEVGIQTAILAPTEVLARQHFLTINELIGLEGAHELELLTGNDKKKERLLKLERLRNADASIVIGTHSLIEESVIFKRLGLVIIDEQHRFGVKQHAAIRSKGKEPDTIAMSATPIPRSLCLTEFADLELVSLKQKPAGRKPIKTLWLTAHRRPGIYNSIRKYVNAGRQCYIVYPLIEESEKIDMQAAINSYEELKHKIFSEFRLALLHGRMKPQEKATAMKEFRSGRVQILVTTSVIEVGVDVANATVMIIEHAERFGISQLHQLRGRVGRGIEQSYCVLISDASGADSQERLQALVESEDGFYLAEMDLKIRGAGEILGLRQHGLGELRLADIVKDRKLTELTHADARTHPELSPPGRAFLCRRFAQGIVIFPD